MKQLLPLPLLLCAALTLSAQGIGLHPPRLDWRQFRVNNTRIIFPAGYEARAFRVGSLIRDMDADHTRSIGDQSYRADLVLQTENTIINGYVGLAPYRSEFYTTPPQSLSLLSSADWVDLLTVHEYRHIQQNNNERRGLTKLLYFLQGQGGWAVLSNIATPNWFSEGDAVIYETALTPAGRGRTPAFSAAFRALLRDGVRYPYPKARNGSFRDLVPDHYRYGYAMLTYARERFGNDVWRGVLHGGAAYRSPLYPFSRALKRATGLTTRGLYRTTLDDLAAAQDSFATAAGPFTRATALGPAKLPPREVLDYRFARPGTDGTVYALRSGYRRLSALVALDPAGGPDRVLAEIGIQREPWLDLRGDVAVWTEYRQHPRYTNENYSDIFRYKLGGSRQRLTRHGHFLSASLSPDRTRIAAVSFEPIKGYPELVILSSADGAEQQRFRLDATAAAWPRFAPDGRSVYYFDQSVEGVAIRALDLGTGRSRPVRERRAEPLDMLDVTAGGQLTFSSGRTGVDNVHVYDPGSGREIRLTNVPVGAYYPAITADGRLFYSQQTSRGLRPFRLETATDKAAGLLPLAAAPSYFERPAGYAAEAEDLSTGVEVGEFPTRNFSNTLGGIQLHSWSYNGNYVNPGVSVAAANALNTVELELEGQYNINEQRYSGGGTARYGGLFPVLSLEAEYRDRNTAVQAPRTDSLRFSTQEFSQTRLSPRITIPLRWASGNYFSGINLSGGLDFFNLRDAETGRLPANFTGVALGAGFQFRQRTAFQVVQSRLGVTADVRYQGGLRAGDGAGRFLFQSSAFLPGLGRTHGIRLDLAFQAEQAENRYQYPEIFRYARGYSAPLADRVVRYGLNYQLPVLYPEFGILGITYFQRVRLNAFYDGSRFTIDGLAGPDIRLDENSLGAQIFFDNVWLNTQDLPVGVEIAYRLNPNYFTNDTGNWNVRLLVSGSF